MLTMSPREVSFFRAVYSRHTNFASGEAEQATNNTPAFGRSNIQTTVARAGDLLSQMYITVDLPRITYANNNSDFSITNGQFTSWTNGIGYAMIEEISAMIGQHEFDTQSGRFMYMRELVSRKPGHKLTEEVGLYDNLAQAAIHSLVPQKLHIPLQFWFNNWLEQSLPMIGLYWHELRMDLSLRSASDLFQTGWAAVLPGGNAAALPTNFDELHYLCNFQYLDRPERAMFANQKLEQIFVQVQYLGEESYLATDTYKQVNIRWNQPVTDTMWVFQSEDSINANNWLDFSGVRFAPIIAGAGAPFTFPAQSMHAPPYKSAQIFLNNNQRTVKLSVENLSTLPAQRGHYRVPHGKFVGTYPFGVEVDGLLHSGSVNFSRMDTAYVRFELWGTTAPAWSYDPTNNQVATPLPWSHAGRIHIYARNFNLCKLSLGMLGVKFAA
ncbi:MAG: major capsid protein [Desulfosporosinus sp.]|nr:major capsid protein [Desulfosporosinus sp.]